MIALLERKQQLYRLIGVTSVTVACFVLLAIQLPGDVPINYPAIYLLVVFAVVTGVLLFLSPVWLISRPHLFWPIAGGLFPLFESLAVYFTGGPRSPLFVLFYFSLFFLGMVGGHRGAVFGSVVVGSAYIAASVSNHGDIGSDSLLRLSTTIASFYGMAFFAAFLGNIASQEAHDASRRAMRLAGLHSINVSLGETLDLDALLEQIPRELCRQLGFERALLYLVDGDVLNPVSGYSGQEPERLAGLLDYLRAQPPRLESRSVEAEAARTLRPTLSIDPERDPRVNPAALSIAQSRCFAAAPMVAKDELIGVVVADYFRRDHSITEEELILLSTFASVVALAILNHRLVLEAGQAEALRRLDALRSDFLATVSHDLRTPITLIKTSADLLLQDVSAGLTQIQKRLVETVSRNTLRLNAFVEEILDMAQLEEGQIDLNLQISDLRHLVNEVAQSLELLVAEKRQTLYLDLTEEPALVEVDRHRMQQIVTNLLTNASKYTPQDGKIWARVLPDPRSVTFEVQDNGFGIPADQIKHIFEKFYRAPGSRERVKGAGLGLTITRSLVELHGGDLKVSSVQGEGTKFCFTLQRVYTSDNILQAQESPVPELRE